MTKLSGTILALLLTTSAVRAQGPPPQCSQATLNGTYVNSGAGTEGGVSVVMVGKVTYDGHGDGQSTFTTSVAGVISRPVAVPGVYTVNPDCTGSKTFGGATDYDFVVTPDGREIYWIVTNANSGSLFTGRAVRLDNSRRSACDQGLLGVHGCSRRLLHDQNLEPGGDQGRLEGLLSAGGWCSAGLAGQ